MDRNAEATRGRARRRLGAPGIRNENEQRRLGSASDRGGGQNSDSNLAEASARGQVRAAAQGEGEPGPARAVCGGGCCSRVGRRRGRRFRGSNGRRLKTGHGRSSSGGAKAKGGGDASVGGRQSGAPGQSAARSGRGAREPWPSPPLNCGGLTNPVPVLLQVVATPPFF